jgi:hypothetical protein
VIAARFFIDPVWWLFVSWLPLYLNERFHFDVKQIGMFAWVPYVGAAVGALAGGWLSGRLLERGWSVDRARKLVIGLGLLLMLPALLLSAMAETPLLAVLSIGVILFGFQATITNIQTLPSDFFSGKIGRLAGRRERHLGRPRRDHLHAAGAGTDHRRQLHALLHPRHLLLPLTFCSDLAGRPRAARTAKTLNRRPTHESWILQVPPARPAAGGEPVPRQAPAAQAQRLGSVPEKGRRHLPQEARGDPGARPRAARSACCSWAIRSPSAGASRRTSGKPITANTSRPISASAATAPRT